MELEHRDILSGIIATNLLKEGFFGEEIYLYGFVVKQEEWVVYYGDSMEQCAKYAYQLLKKLGYMVSACLTVKKRIYGDLKDVETLLLDMFQEAATQYLYREYQVQVTNFVLKRVSLPDKPEEEFADKNMREISGFCYIEQGERKYYCNAFFPNTYSKWHYYYYEKDIKVTEIISMQYSKSLTVADARKRFLYELGAD